jgi:hypothetical protein
MRNVFFVFFIFLSLCVNAQTEKKGLQMNDPIIVNLNLEQSEITFSNLISEVKIIDARDNTNEIGYHSYDEFGKNWAKPFQILPSINEGIAKWITNYLGIKDGNEPSPSKLLIVIKKLWLSSEAEPAKNMQDRKLQPKQLGYDAGVLTKMEFYFEKETVFYPIYKIDTIFTYDKDMYNFTSFYITESLKQSLKKLFRINFDEVLIRGRKLSINEIELNNNRNLAIQILNDVELKKGVYKNFIEFKTNNPSITNY